MLYLGEINDSQREAWLKFDVLLYDLTSTYFESNPPFAEGDKRRFGYSRDHRPDCVQVVIALIVTPEGFPLAYEVLAGNTADNTTLPAFLERIEARYGKARRIWVMDRGIPTEAHLADMRARGACYLVGTPKGRLSTLEQGLAAQPWQQARTDRAPGSGETLGHAVARRTLPDHRRARADLHALHRVRRRPAIAARNAGMDAAATGASAHHRCKNSCGNVVQTFDPSTLKNQTLTLAYMPE